LHYVDHGSIDDADAAVDAKLIFGDFSGSVRVLTFAKKFKSQIREGSLIRQISYHELMKV
jgi:hypothetical protein